MIVIKIFSFFLPWSLRRRILNSCFKYEIHKEARIGLAWVFPGKLIMAKNSRIDHFTIAINLSLINMEANSFIGRSNWITGFPADTKSLHFGHILNRQPSLQIGESTSITKGHHLDCTDRIIIGKFSTLAGYRSQFLTHSIDVVENRQDCSPIVIGDYTYVGTNVVVLGGSALPSHTVLGAKSVLNKRFTKEWMLYAGVPATEKKEISKSAKYFTRQEGYVL